MALGEFFLIASPIGNLADISYRAVSVLQAVDFILCEDTRTSSVLLKKYGITTPTISYHEHSSLAKIKQIIKLLAEGKNLALITDAGTPNISDPGGYLLDSLRAEFADKLRISSLPGPSALSTALALVGTGWDKFVFLGFLPHKKGRQKILQDLFLFPYPVILYESRHRLIKLLQEIIKLEEELSLPKELIIAKELTKVHEAVYQGKPQELLDKFNTDSGLIKGEFVVFIKNKKIKKNK